MATPENLSDSTKKALYWSRVGIEIRKGLKMHWETGQLFPPKRKAEYIKVVNDPNIAPEIKALEAPWRNITEHCLVEVARADVLARWIGLPENVIANIKMAEILEDYSKRQEMEITRQAERQGESPLNAYKTHVQEAENILKEKKNKLGNREFSEDVIYFASAPGGHKDQLLETERILKKTDPLTDDDWGYLIVHYVDDCSIGSDCVTPSTPATEERKNVIDFKSDQNKAKASYSVILKEIGKELDGTPFEGKHNQDVMVILSHAIEGRLAQRIVEQTGESVDPFMIPELVDQRIMQAIEKIT